jgi:hypothetical protein
MLIESDDATVTDPMNTVRNQQPMLKVILKTTGREEEDERPACAGQADWVVPDSTPDRNFLEEPGKAVHTEARLNTRA